MPGYIDDLVANLGITSSITSSSSDPATVSMLCYLDLLQAKTFASGESSRNKVPGDLTRLQDLHAAYVHTIVDLGSTAYWVELRIVAPFVLLRATACYCVLLSTHLIRRHPPLQITNLRS